MLIYTLALSEQGPWRRSSHRIRALVDGFNQSPYSSSGPCLGLRALRKDLGLISTLCAADLHPYFFRLSRVRSGTRTRSRLGAGSASRRLPRGQTGAFLWPSAASQAALSRLAQSWASPAPPSSLPP